MEFNPIQDFANRWNISKRRIQILCKEGRIPGAKMIGNMWVLPENTERPIDARVKSPVTGNPAQAPAVRKELKKLLKVLYESCNKNRIPSGEQKGYVLSIIAGTLCSHYLESQVDSKLVAKLYKSLSSKETEPLIDPGDLQVANDFVLARESDGELEDILSWAYQYSNHFVQDSSFGRTQFFTEKYMVQYLIKNIDSLCTAKKILDPCVGGGNFLAECLEELCRYKESLSAETLIDLCSRLYGYDIDPIIAKVAVFNIRLRVFSILKRNKIPFDIRLWERITPNVFISSDSDSVQGSLSRDDRLLIQVTTRKKCSLHQLFQSADVVLTNPPFSTVKGMRQEQKDFLKEHYPLSNCDTCVAFMEAIHPMLSDNGICGIVSQSAWMHLKSFRAIREWILQNYELKLIVNLGSGAFLDLSGEKTNVSLLIFSKRTSDTDNTIKILNVKMGSFADKATVFNGNPEYLERKQNTINGMNGFDFAQYNVLKTLSDGTEKYKDIAVPMQGTSTGNAKELVGFFWEHFGEADWVKVSNGGGYSRWQGLNDSVVKWGKDGEYIRQQKGSALRNAKYFKETQMVFSDTGTAGLNVRLLHDNQIFIASGPGIRVLKGSEYAHMALLNSRIASYFIRLMSPKLTIAAGYIGQIPVNDKIWSSAVLEKNARLCVELKEKHLSTRANNIEYRDAYFTSFPRDLAKASWVFFNEDLTNELLKLELEWKIDNYIAYHFGLSEKEVQALGESVGECAYGIKESGDIDLHKLDRYLDRLLDSNCCLKRTKTSKNAIGSDGYLEYASKDLCTNPEIIVRRIQENPSSLVNVLNKYQNLILHNYILHCMGYNTSYGVTVPRQSISDISRQLSSAFGEFEYRDWITDHFNETHTEIFKGKPYLLYKEGEVRIDDRFVKNYNFSICQSGGGQN